MRGTHEQNRAAAWEIHCGLWQHCLRCKLAMQRLREDEDSRKRATVVPMACSVDTDAGYLEIERSPPPDKPPILLLLPCPDPAQFRSGRMFGTKNLAGESNSPSFGLVQWTNSQFSDVLPFGLPDVAFGFAFGCRPVNFKDPRKLMAAKQEYIKACRERFAAELQIVDPDLVILCGRHALAIAAPSLATKHARLIGEVVSFQIPTPHGPATYEGYVAPSPEEVVKEARPDHYDIADWEIQPERSHVDHPIKFWLWHYIFACWLADTLRRLEAGDPPLETWGRIVKQYNSFYENRLTVAELIRRTEYIQHEELEGEGARASMAQDHDE